jgi:hypothetical protein
MFKFFPLFLVFSMIALNITGFALMLQLDMLIFHDVIAKIVAWVVTTAAWVLVYVYRNK